MSWSGHWRPSQSVLSKILQKSRPGGLRKLRGRHETTVVFSLCLCLDELGSGCRALLFRYREEGHLVETQICAPAQDLGQTSFEVKVISDANEFNSIAPQWDSLVSR